MSKHARTYKGLTDKQALALDRAWAVAENWLDKSDGEIGEILGMAASTARLFRNALGLNHGRGARLKPGATPGAADVIRARRALAGIPLRELGKAAGMSHANVAHIESGIRRLTADNEKRLTAALDELGAPKVRVEPLDDEAKDEED